MAKHVKADLDDMLFEDREQNYGAYILRKRYPRHLTTAVGIVAFLTLVGGFGPIIAKTMGWIEAKVEKKERIVKIKISELPPPPKPETQNDPPPPPPPPVRKVLKQMDFRIPEPSPEPDRDDTTTIHKIEDLVDQNLSFADVDGIEEALLFDVSGEEDVPEVLIDNRPDPGKFIVADEEPNPVNIKDITRLIGYPPVARDAGIQGKVLLRVLVDKYGNYEEHILTNGVHPILSEVVEKHISKLKFTPALQGGRPIKFWVNIPFNFVLQQ